MPSPNPSPVRSFFQHTYDKYTPHERTHQRWLFTADGIGVPVFTAAYVSIAIGLAAETDSSSDSSFAPPPVWVDALSWFFAGLASFVLYQHIFVAPFPTEDDEMFKVTQKIGRWVFLTRQTLCLQGLW